MAQTRTDGKPDPIALAAELRPLLTSNAARVEQARRLTDENIQALERANLFKLMVPRRWGGYGAPAATFMSAFAEIARGCASTAWTTMIINGVSWLASLLPDSGQEEIFADPANSRVSGVFSMTARGQRAEGGFRITGRFPFASGCLHSSWAALSFLIEDNTHPAGDEAFFGFMPMSEIEIEDTWFVAGMCGTGSNTLVAKDLFIPDHRTFSLSQALKGDYPHRRHSGETSDRYAFAPVLVLILLGPVIGTAQALLAEIRAGARKRGIAYTIYSRQADAPIVQRDVAEAALKIDGAWLHTLRCANDIQDTAASGSQMDYLTRARIRGECGYVGKLVRDAIDELVSIGGASGFAEASPLQRMWRDVNVATRHALLATSPNLELYGNALLGLKDNITAII